MYKSKSIRVVFGMDTSLVDILPTISICLYEKGITFRWIIFEIDISY